MTVTTETESRGAHAVPTNFTNLAQAHYNVAHVMKHDHTSDLRCVPGTDTLPDTRCGDKTPTDERMRSGGRRTREKQAREEGVRRDQR
jgi:hypothetical protein